MKTNTKQIIIAELLFIIMIATYTSCKGQTLTIHPQVTLNNKLTLEVIRVTIIDMDIVDAYKNVNLNIIKGVTYKLDDNKDYLIVFQVDGFQSKSIMVSTNYTSNQKYMYNFIVNLSSKDVVPDIKYAGGIFFNIKKNEFDYYLTNYEEN